MRGLLARGASGDSVCLPARRHAGRQFTVTYRPNLSAYSGGTAWALHPLPCSSGDPAAIGHLFRCLVAEYSTLEFPAGSQCRARLARGRTGRHRREASRPRERLTLEDGVRLFEAPDLLAVGWLANREREKRHGARTYFNYNLRLEPTNVCEASCLFCSFARLQPGMPQAYTMSLEQAWDKLRQRANQPLTEVHIVNGLNPDLPFSYYTELLRGFKRIRPGIHLKCFTAVEIAFFADLYGMTDEQVLRELMEAGLDSLPGGGAEIFAERVRRKICHDKCGADRYLAIHRIAHRLGLRTNVTMLYGHIETMEERVDHMLRARALQDETGGFQAFIPLAFHPDNNQMRKLPAPTRAPTRCACTPCRG